MSIITNISSLPRLVSKDSTAAANIKNVDFGSKLNDAINAMNEAEKTSQKYDQMVATGDVDNLHDAMIAAQKAEIVLNFGLEIRNQVLEAYKELMRIQF